MSNAISFDEQQNQVQDRFIQLITESAKSPFITVWKPEDRIKSDSELEKEFIIYNAFVYVTHYSSKSKKTKFDVRIGINFDPTPLHSCLSYETECLIRAWSRAAAKSLDSYFLKYYSNAFPGYFRFDLLTLDKIHFIFPDLNLYSNVIIFRDISTANTSHHKLDHEDNPLRIPVEEIVKTELENLKVIEACQARIHLANSPFKQG